MKYILLLLSIMICSCGPQEPFEEQRETTKVDSSYYLRNMANSLYVLTVVSLLMDMSVKIVNTQKKDEKIQTYT